MSTPNRVTEQDIEARIIKTEFHILPGTTTTVCVITLDNGWNETGISACVDPANFSKEEGEKWSRIQAFNKLWVPLGFLLKEKLHQEGGTFITRLKTERDELVERLAKLGKFLASPQSDNVPTEALDDLKLQHKIMTELGFILSKRYDEVSA